MTKTLILVGSPRAKKSTSYSFCKYLEEQFKMKGVETSILILRNQLNSEEKTTAMLHEIDSSDIIILIAPLYDDAQPYIVIRLMEMIAEKNMKLEAKRFFPIMNCGFIESVHMTAVAIPIFRKFAQTVGFKWAGSMAIPVGEMFQGKHGKLLTEVGKIAEKMMTSLEEVAETLSNGDILPDMVPKVYPGFFYWKILKRPLLKMSTKGWQRSVEAKGQKVDAKPYLE